MDVQTSSSTLERAAPPAERLPSVEASKPSIIEAAAESPEAAKELVEQSSDDAVVEVKDFTNQFPDIDPAVKAQADAAEAEIRGLAMGAETEIAKVTGETAPPGEEAKVEGIKTEAPKATAPETAAEVFTLDAAVAELDTLVADYKAKNNQADPDMVKRLRNLMARAHPDKMKDDPKAAQFSSMLGRLKMAFGGDASSWKNPRGGSFEEDFAAFKEEGAHVEAPKGEAPGAVADAAEVGTPKTEAPEAKKESEAAQTPTAEVPSDEGIEAAAERAFESEDEKNIKAVLEDINGRMDERVAARTQELNALYAKPDRGEADQARIDALEYANGIDRKRKDLRKEQFEFIRLKKKQEEIDERIAAVQLELKPYEGAQDQNLLAVTAEAGRSEQALAVTDKRQELQAALATLVAEREAITKQMEHRLDRITDLKETMEKLAELMERAKSQGEASEEKESEEKEEEPTEEVEEESADSLVPGGGTVSAEGARKPGQERKEKTSWLEKAVDYAAAPFEKWLDFTFDPKASSQATIGMIERWGKELGATRKK